jgi:hypothetical protein
MGISFPFASVWENHKAHNISRHVVEVMWFPTELDELLASRYMQEADACLVATR